MNQISTILISLFVLGSYSLSGQQPQDVIVPSKFTLPYSAKTDYEKVKYERLPESQIVQPDDPEKGVYAENGVIRYIAMPSKGEYSVILIPHDGGDFPYCYYLCTFKGNRAIDALYVEGEWSEPDSGVLLTTSFSIDTTYTITVSTNTENDTEKTMYHINEKGKFYGVEDNSTFTPDTTVNGKLILRNYQSAGSLTYGVSQPKMHDSQVRLCTFSCFLNDKGTQYLLAYFYEGSLRGEYSAFEIGYVDDMTWLDEIESDKTTEVRFATESGIRLGMSEQELARIKGRPLRKSEDEDGDRFSYQIDAQSDFCRRYRMPDYTMTVLLVEGIVHRISFGFEYP